MGNCENYNYGNQYENDCGCCGNRRERNIRTCCGLCAMRILCFFVVALAAALGLIFGAVYAEQILTALAAIIVFAVVMAVAIIALLFYRWCECR